MHHRGLDAEFKCGLHQPASPAVTHAGYATGKAMPIVIGAIVIVLILTAWTRRFGKKTAATSK